MPTATRMWALEGPTFTLPAGFLVLHEEGSVTIPVPCFLIEHPRGLVLFDTGISSEAADDPVAVFSADELRFNHLVYEDYHRPERQIAAAGFRLDQITHVVISHVHHDHSGGLKLFPHAQFFSGVGEMPHAYWPFAAQRGLFRHADLDPIREFSWNEVPTDYDLFGDGSVTILTLPGHTPGSIGLLVKLPTQNFVLTGDAVHLRAGIEKVLPMGGDWSTHQSVLSIQKMLRIQRTYDANIWIGHDPLDWAEFTASGHELR